MFIETYFIVSLILFTIQMIHSKEATKYLIIKSQIIDSNATYIIEVITRRVLLFWDWQANVGASYNTSTSKLYFQYKQNIRIFYILAWVAKN